MRDLRGFAVWLGGVMFVSAAVVLMFYTAALVLPVLLVVFIVSMFANWGIAAFRKTKGSPRQPRNKIRPQNSTSRIIDAEYEIVDEDSHKSNTPE